MTGAMAHRGPDGSGQHHSGRVSLGARRLSIVGLDAPTQPVHNGSGTLAVVLNGEIYNHAALRNHLTGLGHTFSTRCDTEVLVHLYEEYGRECVHHLRGMFAFAVADGDTLFLARDRYGIKPLHYTFVGDNFLFASEIKAILRHPGVTPRFNTAAFVDEILIGAPTDGQTFLEGILALPPGHTLVSTPDPAGRRSVTVRSYDTDPEGARELFGFEDAQTELLSVLRESVELHLAADVEVGLLLSGGLDSAVLAVLAAESDRPARRSFSIADTANHPDLVHSRRIARSLGLSHQEHVVRRDEYFDAIPSYLAALERPARTSAIPMHLLSGLLGEELKVGLLGEGADELFGGYDDYLDPRCHATSVYAARLARIEAIGGVPSPRALEVMSALSAQQPRSSYLAAVFDANFRELLVQNHLEPHDKLAMHHGVELRVPYLDQVVVDCVRRIPQEYLVRSDLGIPKYVLKHLALRTWPGNEVLIDSVLRRKLGAPASGSQLERAVVELCEVALPDDYLTGHELGGCFPNKSQLLMHELFREIFLDRRGDVQGLSFTEFLRSRRAQPAALTG